MAEYEDFAMVEDTECFYNEKPEYCPVCGSDSVEVTDSFNAMGKDGWEECYCYDCQSRWCDEWKYGGSVIGGQECVLDTMECCPNCLSKNIDADFFDSNGREGWEKVECEDCGVFWTDYWKYEQTIMRERNAHIEYRVGTEVVLSDEAKENGNYEEEIGDRTMVVIGCGIGSDKSGGFGGPGYDDGVFPEPLYDLAFEDGEAVPVSLYGWELESA